MRFLPRFEGLEWEFGQLLGASPAFLHLRESGLVASSFSPRLCASKVRAAVLDQFIMSAVELAKRCCTHAALFFRSQNCPVPHPDLLSLSLAHLPLHSSILSDLTPTLFSTTIIPPVPYTVSLATTTLPNLRPSAASLLKPLGRHGNARNPFDERYLRILVAGLTKASQSDDIEVWNAAAKEVT